MNVAASIVIHVEQLCHQCPSRLLGIKPTLGPGTPGDNRTDATRLPRTHRTETQTVSPKPK